MDIEQLDEENKAIEQALANIELNYGRLTPVQRLSMLTKWLLLPSEDEIARAIYDAEPYEEAGESIDGFQVTPGGPLSWEKACAYDAEFGDDVNPHPITDFPRRAARAVLERIRKGA
jgi:hypothetical protein